MEQHGEAAVVRCAGDYDISSRSALRAAFQAVADHPHIIADLKGVEAIDSTTIAELMRAHRHAVERGGALVIVTQDSRTIRLLSIAGVTESIAISASIDAARSLLRPTQPHATNGS